MLVRTPHNRYVLYVSCCDLCRPAQDLRNSRARLTASYFSNTSEVLMVAAGQVRCCCQIADDASQLPLSPSGTPVQKKVPAYYSSTSMSAPIPSTHACKTTASVLPTRAISASSGSASTLRHQDAPASAGQLTFTLACKTISQLRPADAMQCDQIHTSGQASPCCRPCFERVMYTLWCPVRQHFLDIWIREVLNIYASPVHDQ